MNSGSPSAPISGLPSKEAALFKSVLKFYDHKQYKKGLKVCEQILKKHPEHSETLAMKGLFLSNLGRREEGYEQVRAGLRKNIRSHLCWHVYGLIYRGEKNYEEAMKCYRNALKYDKDNGQILRDLAVLQLQLRQFEALCETRYTLLTQKPTLRLHWLSLTLAYHLCRRYAEAVEVLDAFLEGLPTSPPEISTPRAQSLERSEILLYRIFIQQDAGRPEEALQTLEREKGNIVDALEYHQRRASLLQQLGRLKEAAVIWKMLLANNPDSLEALQNWLHCQQITTVGETLVELQRLQTVHPSSLLFKMRFLHHCPTDQLAMALDQIVLPMLHKGVFSTFSCIDFLYQDRNNWQVLETFCQSILDTNNGANSTHTTVGHYCSILFVAQHQARLGREANAVKLLERAVSIAPGIPEVFLYYAKILKAFGHRTIAADCMDYARRLDLSDRFLNSKCVKYMLCDGRAEQAKKLAVIFVKKGQLADQLRDLIDMQAIWFVYEMGCTYQRQQNHLLALCYFEKIHKYFEDFYDDQFDFHNYVLRRLTFSHYIKMLRYEDTVFAHPYYKKTAMAAIQSLVILERTKKEVSSVLSSLNNLTLRADSTLDETVLGERMADKQKDHGVMINRWLLNLEKYRPLDVNTHILSFKIYIKQGRIIKAARALWQHFRLKKDDPLIIHRRRQLEKAIQASLEKENVEIEAARILVAEIEPPQNTPQEVDLIEVLASMGPEEAQVFLESQQEDKTRREIDMVAAMAWLSSEVYTLLERHVIKATESGSSVFLEMPLLRELLLTSAASSTSTQ